MKKLITIAIIAICIINVYLYTQTVYMKNEIEKQKMDVHLAKQDVHAALEEIKETYLAVQSFINSLDLIYNTAEKYNVSPVLALAVMKVESNFDPYAVNGYSRGLMQLDHRYYKSDLFDIETNVECSFSLLSQLEKESDTLEEVLGKYNRGVTGYKDYVSRTGETVTAYSKKVMSIMDTLNK